MDRGRVEAIARRELTGAALPPHERAIEALVIKSAQAPARLEPADMEPVRAELGGAGALEVVAMLSAFHFINRMADLVGIRSDLPLRPESSSLFWRLGVRVQGFFLGRLLDLSNQVPDAVDLDRVLDQLAALRGRAAAPGYQAVREAPGVAAWLSTSLVGLPRLDRAMLDRVAAAVAAALPKSVEEIRGFPARPSDPLEALAFVGTRFPARTTDALADAARRAYGWGDAELTDAFFAVSMCNCLERLDRLFAEPLQGMEFGSRTARPA